MKIINASNIPLNQQTGTLPNVSGTLQGWMQPMVFTSIVKTVVNFKVVETPTSISFKGVWQPFTARQLLLKPEGQRSWSWYTLHAEPGIVLNPDEVVTYLGVQYRVMDSTDYSLYGYVEYHLVQDYVGVSP